MIEKVTNQLKYPPIKNVQKQIPDKLIFHKGKAPLQDIYDVVMFTTKEPFYRTEMSYFKSNWNDALGITMLKSFPRKKGLGTAMLKYALKLSEEIGCGGRIFLQADSMFTPNEAPHLFYRKFGMNTGYKEIDDKMDRFISKNKHARYLDFCSNILYYPPVKYPKESLWSKIKNFIKIL